MKVQKITKSLGSMAVLIALLLILPFPGVLSGAEIPSFEDVINGKAEVPTIDALTGGKVQIGDMINKDNVDLVKDYLSAGVYEAIKQGMVLRMGKQLPADKLVPKSFKEVTERNKGKAIVDEGGAVYYEQMGTLWPGGVPFANPKNGLEAMSNAKYGGIYDGFEMDPSLMTYTNPKGKTYKSSLMHQMYFYYTTRKKDEPVGSIPGYEDILYKRISVFLAPLELKGLGQYTVRHYDDANKFDTGFAYFPAYKRTVRVSATTWQDNIGGSDMTYGGAGGLSEPFSYWDFKLVGKKFILACEPDAPFHVVDEKTRDIDKRVQFTVGTKFPITGWAVWPMYVVEGTPRIKHIYGKKMFYVHAWPYWPSAWQIGVTECYDRQKVLWKVLWNRRIQAVLDGESYTAQTGGPAYDLQTQHMTMFWYIEKPFKTKPEAFTMQKLLAIGK